ncbi:MAG: recombinase [Ruminiclostridium sp.]|nr:recombinase [Ruminiclostridium sp.]
MGWDIEKIKNWLRHTDIRTTSNVYTHISKDRKKIMAKEIDDFLG